MSEPFLSEIRMVSFDFPPQGWAFCNGQLLPINQNQALFSLLGTTYGGDGRVTFALPDLRGRTAVHVGNGIILGESAGEQTHTLTVAEMAGHTHSVQGNSSPANVATPVGNVWAQHGANPFSSQANAGIWVPAPSRRSAEANRIRICSPTWSSTLSSPCRGYSHQEIKGEKLWACPT